MEVIKLMLKTNQFIFIRNVLPVKSGEIPRRTGSWKEKSERGHDIITTTRTLSEEATIKSEFSSNQTFIVSMVKNSLLDMVI